MKKIALSIMAGALSTTLGQADQVLNIDTGWQLMGTTNHISEINQFNKNSINMIWAFDKLTKKWSVYSPDSGIQNSIASNTNINILTSIQENMGFWVSANTSDTIIITEEDANLTLLPISDEIINTYPIYDLTDEQKKGLIFMYQEEKVARDVYLNMYDTWGLKIFSNIAKAEQMHMNAVKTILEKYNLDIPVSSDIRGEFDLEELQTLYNTLMTSANISSNEALKVGKLIEETDIADLEHIIIDSPDDIKVIYQKLLNGSYNHLNAFNKNIVD